MPEPVKPDKIKSLQSIRTFAFIGVFMYHAYATYMEKNGINKMFAPLGAWGVSVFLVLSGFTMTYSYWNRVPDKTFKSCIKFSINKIRFLYPLHLLMLFIGSAYWYFHGISLQMLVKELILTVPLMQTWSSNEYQAINSVAWYLSVCFFLYFCFPVILRFVKKSAKCISPILFMIGVYLLQLFVAYLAFIVKKHISFDLMWIVYCHPLFRLGDFLIGCFLAAMFRKRKKYTKTDIRNASLMEMFAVIINIIACYINVNCGWQTAWFSFTCLFIPSSAVLIYVFAVDAGIISKVITNKCSMWLASITPYGFLIHRIILWISYDVRIYPFLSEKCNKIFNIAMAFVVTVSSSYIQGTYNQQKKLLTESRL